MRQWISKEIESLRNRRRVWVMVLLAIVMSGCEKAITEDVTADDGDVVLRFQHNSGDVTRAGGMAAYCSKLNVQLFDADGQKVFATVKTQTSQDDDFGSLSLKLQPGTYWVVAVGHSSKNSATIKSLESVQFTASDGEKLTDTFCHCSQIDVSGETADYTLPMYRVGAMIQFCLTDENVPETFAYFLMEYTGGSANFNPQTLEGNTKSTQSERRMRNSLMTHQAFTFPYMAATGSIKMTVSATDTEGTVIRKRVFENVPVTRNRITTYTGHFFEDGDGSFTQSDFGFVVHADWDGEEFYEF